MNTSFVKYNNSRTGKVTSWNYKNANKPESQFIKDNQHLGYTEDELKEAHGLIISTVENNKNIKTEENSEILEKQLGKKGPRVAFSKETNI